ncbi:MAG: type VI secretion system-associated protein TagF [Deltaproteobacteria bacterium]|nr:type VI secretion system-associated protein TagF [Deltaproteobacteria bacterium]
MAFASLPRMKEPTVGLYGKIPAERDFVRINAGEFQHAGLDQWFAQGIECLHTERLRLPDEAVHFVLVAPNGDTFVGGMRPGEDAVGRNFPLVISVRLEARRLLDALPLFSSVFGPFFEAATTVAEAARGLSTQDLAAQVDWLKQTLEQSAPSLPLDELLAGSSFFELRVAIGGLHEGGAYALSTLVTACEQAIAKAPESAKQTTTLECPTPTDGMRAFWLELIRRRLGASAPAPSLMWTANRLLVSLGPAPPQLLAFVANPEHKSQRYWPLHTDVPAANEKAVQSLTPAQSQLLASGQASLAGVLATFGAR